MQIRNFVVLAGPLAVLSLASACVLTITDGETASASTTDASTVAATGSSGTGSDGSTGTPTGSGTDATTGSSTDTPTGTVESSTTEEDPTTGSETGAPAGACGWIEADNIYACGGVGEDPDGIIPIDCPEPPVTDAPCDGGQGPIADPGCCYEGLNAYCYLGKLVVEQCR